MFKRLIHFLSRPLILALFNGALIAISIWINLTYQAFCQPVLWAKIILVITFIQTILYPLLVHSKLSHISDFVAGISFGVFLYCVLFLGSMTLYGLLFSILGIGLFLFIPHFFAIQLLHRHLIKPKVRLTKTLFSLGFLSFISTAIILGIHYKKASKEIERSRKSHYATLEKNFMTEKILGMYFKYHTEYCFYDGWRPHFMTRHW